MVTMDETSLSAFQLFPAASNFQCSSTPWAFILNELSNAVPLHFYREKKRPREGAFTRSFHVLMVKSSADFLFWNKLLRLGECGFFKTAVICIFIYIQ